MECRAEIVCEYRLYSSNTGLHREVLEIRKEATPQPFPNKWGPPWEKNPGAL